MACVWNGREAPQGQRHDKTVSNLVSSVKLSPQVTQNTHSNKKHKHKQTVRRVGLLTGVHAHKNKKKTRVVTMCTRRVREDGARRGACGYLSSWIASVIMWFSVPDTTYVKNNRYGLDQIHPGAQRGVRVSTCMAGERRLVSIAKLQNKLWNKKSGHSHLGPPCPTALHMGLNLHIIANNRRTSAHTLTQKRRYRRKESILSTVLNLPRTNPNPTRP